jgi:hypothetical protein
MPTVTPGGTPADSLGLNDSDRIALVTQMNCGRQAGIAATDNAYIDFNLPFQAGEIEVPIGAGRVPGIDVFGVWHKIKGE